MKKSKIYTRTGDKGETSLVSGSRILKSDVRIDLYGDLDELNSRIGYAVSLMSVKYPSENKFLHVIQSALFDLGSNMACEAVKRASFKLPQLSDALIHELENEIDKMDNELEPLKNFILPGGSLSSSALHLARTYTRSVERKFIQYEKDANEELPALSVVFLNRLSDYLFVLARYVNKKENCEEILWKPRH